MSREGEHPKIVVIHRAQSRSEAQIVVSVLRSAGIPAYVDGQFLNDEFAASQAIMNLGSVEVQVPHEAAAEARKILAEARASAEESGPFIQGDWADDPSPN